MLVTASKQIACSLTGDGLIVVAFGSTQWNDETWREYCANCCKLREEAGGPPIALFLYSPVKAPTAEQRNILQKEFAERLGFDKHTYGALLSDSMVARGALTAVAWLTGMKTRTFRPDLYRDGLRWLAETKTFEMVTALELLSEAIRAVGYGPGALDGNKQSRLSP